MEEEPVNYVNHIQTDMTGEEEEDCHDTCQNPLFLSTTTTENHRESVEENIFNPSGRNILQNSLFPSPNVNFSLFGGGLDHEGLDLEATCDSKIIFRIENPIPGFYGRQSFLQELHRTIQKQNERMTEYGGQPLTIVHGLGGVGKTETVKMYISQYRSFYDNIIWINAHNTEALTQSLLALALKHMPQSIIGPPFDQSSGKERSIDIEAILPQIYTYLSTLRTLLVFDNVEEFHDEDSPSEPSGGNCCNLSHKNGIKSFLPHSTLGRPSQCQCQWKNLFVLLTSWTTPTWVSAIQNERFSAHVIPLNPFTMEEGVDFLRGMLRGSGRENQSDFSAIWDQEVEKDAGMLVGMVEGIPLALGQVVPFLKEKGRRGWVTGRQNSIKDYIREIRTVELQNFEKKARNTDSTIPMVLHLYQVTKKVLENDHGVHGSLAVQLIQQMATVNPNFSTSLKFLPIIFPKIPNKVMLQNSLILLQQYGLINVTINSFEDPIVSLRRLLGHAVLVDQTQNGIQVGVDCQFEFNNHSQNPTIQNEGYGIEENDGLVFTLQKSSVFLASMLNIVDGMEIQRFTFNLALGWNFDSSQGHAAMAGSALFNGLNKGRSEGTENILRVKRVTDVPSLLKEFGFQDDPLWTNVLGIVRPILNEFFFKLLDICSNNLSEWPVFHCLLRRLVQTMLRYMEWEKGEPYSGVV